MKTLPVISAFFIASSLNSQVNIIPRPVQLKTEPGFLTMKQPIGFIYSGKHPADDGASYFKEYLATYYKISQFKTGEPHSGGFPTEIFVDYDKNYVPKEGYKLVVDHKGVTLRGGDAGLFYAFQTLIQLLPPENDQATDLKIPFVSIEDYPRFEYRGMHLDCGRHFFPVSFIKKYIDFIALHKMNYFHWHLTEDQGWRIEIKKYPRLTEVGAWRNGTIIGRYPGLGNDGVRYGGFYTQDDIKDVVAYAAKRHITVIPEIEMPGHSSAAIAAYPFLSCFPEESTKHRTAWSGDSTGKQVQQAWGVFDDVFCAGRDSTFKFLEDVLDEVMMLFPSKYIHVGGDECPKTNWKRCPFCQQRIRNEHLKDEHELQSYFIQRIEKYLNSKGRTLIGWDEILEGGLAPNAVVMSWRGEAGGIAAARQKHNVVMTPGAWVYLDHSQSLNEDSVTIGGYTPVDKTYNYEPVSDSLTTGQGKYILGAQGNVWTEYMTNDRKVEYMIFPRMSALSEVLWSEKKDKDSADFENRLQTQFKRYELWGVDYSKALYELKSTVLPADDLHGVQWQLEGRTGGYIGYSPSTASSAVVKYVAPVRISEDATITAMYFIDSHRVSSVTQKFFVNKATGRKITLVSQPGRTYQGDGAFTLVNGIRNEKGLDKPKEFLGFNGTDCEATIDLGSAQQISNVRAYIFEQTPSWIYRPKFFQVLISTDNSTYTEMGMTDLIQFDADKQHGTMTVQQKSVSARYVKIKLGNYGSIPVGNPGAGSKAWLFVDEIEVN